MAAVISVSFSSARSPLARPAQVGGAPPAGRRAGPGEVFTVGADGLIGELHRPHSLALGVRQSGTQGPPPARDCSHTHGHVHLSQRHHRLELRLQVLVVLDQQVHEIISVHQLYRLPGSVRFSPCVGCEAPR